MELNNNTLLMIALLIAAYFYFNQSTENFNVREGICNANNCRGWWGCRKMVCKGCPRC